MRLWDGTKLEKPVYKMNNEELFELYFMANMRHEHYKHILQPMCDMPIIKGKKIVNNLNISIDFLNKGFKSRQRYLKYLYLKYAFNYLTEENKIIGLSELEENNYQYCHCDLNKNTLIKSIGIDNYNKYTMGL